MPYLNEKYTWDELLREMESGLFEDTKCITMDSLDEMIRDLEGEIIETMG
jgi:hypothetical protein